MRQRAKWYQPVVKESGGADFTGFVDGETDTDFTIDAIQRIFNSETGGGGHKIYPAHYAGLTGSEPSRSHANKCHQRRDLFQ